MKMFSSKALLCAGALLIGFSLHAQTVPQLQSPIPVPDPRYKADVLVVVAHPDDDTAVSTFLAKAVLDQGKSAAVIFTNRGNGGPNAVGMEQSRALADVREMEARRSLAARGITNVWFLQGLDTPTQDVLHSLETMGHGAALEEMVRLIRLTRPDVIVTWMPAYVAGENHGDHQASGVVATEAFDLAGDPTAFPEQVSAPRYNRGIANYGEGLHPWQPKKLYFFSDASHPDFLKGHGPTYLATDISPSRHVPYSRINREAWKDYATQVDFGDDTLRYYTDMPEYLILGKSLVPSSSDADVFAGIDDNPIPFAPQPPYNKRAATGFTMELGGPWAFYREFYPVHSLTALEHLVPPQTALGADHQLWVPLLLHNDSPQAMDITLEAHLPSGWSGYSRNGIYHLPPNSSYPVQCFLTAPAGSGQKTPEILTWTATRDGRPAGKVNLTFYAEYNGVPQ
ncbi:MAG TPA: PIG-L family deacetylase [Acidobacteriaceae bacterium]|nr:PIG-L family deacetylase [Acidobacteriaceae bacterium]